MFTVRRDGMLDYVELTKSEYNVHFESDAKQREFAYALERACAASHAQPGDDGAVFQPDDRPVYVEDREGAVRVTHQVCVPLAPDGSAETLVVCVTQLPGAFCFRAYYLGLVDATRGSTPFATIERRDPYSAVAGTRARYACVRVPILDMRRLAAPTAELAAGAADTGALPPLHVGQSAYDAGVYVFSSDNRAPAETRVLKHDLHAWIRTRRAALLDPASDDAVAAHRRALAPADDALVLYDAERTTVTTMLAAAAVAGCAERYVELELALLARRAPTLADAADAVRADMHSYARAVAERRANDTLAADLSALVALVAL